MATKSGNKGRYICKVGFYDIYAKDTLKPKKESKFKWLKGEVKSTEYVVYHSKKAIEKGLKTKDMAVIKAVELLGTKAQLYSL
jgi:ribosomal protein S16